MSKKGAWLHTVLVTPTLPQISTLPSLLGMQIDGVFLLQTFVGGSAALEVDVMVKVKPQWVGLKNRLIY